MRNIATRLFASAPLAFCLAGCAHHDPPPPSVPPTVQVAPAAPTPGYRDGTSTPTLAATPSATPPATVAAPLSTPNPLALPCTADAACLTHRC